LKPLSQNIKKDRIIEFSYFDNSISETWMLISGLLISVSILLVDSLLFIFNIYLRCFFSALYYIIRILE